MSIEPHPPADMPPWSLLRDGGLPVDGDPAAVDETGDRTATPDPPVICRRCTHPVTTLDARTTVHGEAEHVRTNPHGFVFHIRLFSQAPGVVAIGSPTTDHTWFAGHAWRIALCGGCRVHLGWVFDGERRFVGLVADRIV